MLRTGTTTDAYVEADRWVCLPYLTKRAVITNTGLTNALKYKILYTTSLGGTELTDVSEATVNASSNANTGTTLDHAACEVVFYVKSSVAGSHTTYSIEYVGIMP